jgi:hypothetical protein
MAVVLRSKEEVARCMLRSETVAWFRDQPIDQRDQDLINADHVGFVDYNKGSYLRKIVRYLREHTVSIPLTYNLVSHETR